MNSSTKAHISLFVAQVIYALNYSIAKDLMPDQIKPLGLVLMRVGGACLLFWLVSLFTQTEKVAQKDLKRMMLLAVFGVSMNQIFFIYGLSLTKPINSAIIMVSNPIAVMLFTLLILKEKITGLKITGLLLGVVGALTLLLFRANGSFAIGSETVVGDLMTLVNSLSWAVFVVMVRPYMQQYKTVTVMKWVFLFGVFYVFPLGISDVIEVEWGHLTLPTIFSMSFVVIATTFLAYLLNTYALKTVSSSVLSMYIYLQPFLATFFAILWGKDDLTVTKIMSALFIIMGVYLVSRKKTDKS